MQFSGYSGSAELTVRLDNLGATVIGVGRKCYINPGKWMVQKLNVQLFTPSWSPLASGQGDFGGN